jgi:hypothetical protein
VPDKDEIPQTVLIYQGIDLFNVPGQACGVLVFKRRCESLVTVYRECRDGPVPVLPAKLATGRIVIGCTIFLLGPVLVLSF